MKRSPNAPRRCHPEVLRRIWLQARRRFGLPQHDALARVGFVVILIATSLAAANPVSLTEDADTYTLANGLVTAKIDKHSGSLASLNYKSFEILDPTRHRPQGYWSHTAASDQMTQRVTIDPKTNNGERGEVSIKGISNGHRMGSGPGGSVIADIEIRYCLERDLSGVYTYTILDHKSDYPATNLGEARYCAKLNDDVFDWMTIDADRNLKMHTAYDWNHGIVMNMKEARKLTSGVYAGHVEHKYDYSANQFDVRAWGWSSTRRGVGVWFINPSIEYLSGGPTKVELSAHRDATFNPEDKNAPAPPCLLNYWRGSHYGGSSCTVAQGEHWDKVVGPFLIYCNSGASPDAMWKDALACCDSETSRWPYGWVDGVDYPHQDQRGGVTGQLVLNDPQASSPRLEHLLVGVAHSDYDAPEFQRNPVGTTPVSPSSTSEPSFPVQDRARQASPLQREGPRHIDWQLDAKFYQTWTRADADGKFTIRDVRPGTYTLHAIADNVLGEFARVDVTISAGTQLDLGVLEWKPVRYGKQIWEIGVPDRTAREFRHGDHFWQWGLYYDYAKEFPSDVNFIIGKSDARKDWNYAQPPRIEPKGEAGLDPREDKITPSTWSITFEMSAAPTKGKATLRLGIAGARVDHGIDVSLNDQEIGNSGPLPDTGVMHRDGIRGTWCERDVIFDASALKPGTNVIKLHVPARSWVNGVLYDYLRLEIAD